MFFVGNSLPPNGTFNDSSSSILYHPETSRSNELFCGGWSSAHHKSTPKLIRLCRAIKTSKGRQGVSLYRKVVEGGGHLKTHTASN